jgi:hypothetical protein
MTPAVRIRRLRPLLDGGLAWLLRAADPGDALMRGRTENRESGAHGASRSAPWSCARSAAAVALCAASVPACISWTNVPPSQLPALLAARGDSIEVTDGDGDRVEITRSEIRQVEVTAREGWQLMREEGPGGRVVSIPEAHVGEAEDRGWKELPSFDAPFRLQLQGELLGLRGRTGTAALVPLRDIQTVSVKELSPGKTALLVLASLAGAGVVGAIFFSACDDCLMIGPSK